MFDLLVSEARPVSHPSLSLSLELEGVWILGDTFPSTNKSEVSFLIQKRTQNYELSVCQYKIRPSYQK